MKPAIGVMTDISGEVVRTPRGVTKRAKFKMPSRAPAQLRQLVQSI